METLKTLKKTDIIANSRYFYYVALAVYVLSISLQNAYAYNIWSVENSPMLTVLQAMRYCAYLLCILRLLFLEKVKSYSVIICIVFFLFSCYAWMTGPQKAPIFFFILLIAAYDTDFKTIVKIFMAIQLATLIVYVLLSFTSVYGNVYVDDFDRVRYFLGYAWVNRASYCWLFLCLEYFYLRKNRFNTRESIVAFLVSTFIYIKTDTAFSFLMTLIIIIVALVNNIRNCVWNSSYKKTKSKTYIYIAMGIFIACVIFGILVTFAYNPNSSIYVRINGIVNGRLSLGKYAIEEYGLHLGGNDIHWVGSSTLLFGLSDSTKYFYVDNGFLQLALEYGILFAGLFVYFYCMSIKRSLKNRDWAIPACILYLGLLFIFEPYVIDFAFNPFCIYFFTALSLSSKKKAETISYYRNRQAVKFKVL